MQESISNVRSRTNKTLRLQKDETLHVLKCDNGSDVGRYTLQIEAGFLSELRHPNIVTMYRRLELQWPTEDSIALDLEHCARGNVADTMLSTASLRTCFQQMLGALRYMHSQGAHTISLSTAKTASHFEFKSWISFYLEIKSWIAAVSRDYNSA